jgi:serine/threonine protein kinase
VECAAVPSLLPLIVTGRLSAAAAARLAEHLGTCARCTERVERARTGVASDTNRLPAFDTAAIKSSDEEIPIPPTNPPGIPPTNPPAAPDGTVAYGSDTGGIEEPTPGTVLGSYVVIDEIARGGMGIVYRANQKGMNRVVALKVLPAQALDDEELVLRFIREARAAAELNHPNVVRIYDIGRDGPFVWFSMEYVEGRSLKAWIEKEGKLPPKKALDVAIACAHALEAAEAKKIVHRDVKPDNLLVTEDGTVKLADLGLVRHASQKKTQATLTRAGDLLGTPAYMSPEQARESHGADNRSDLWSLGATLYHALFGVPPFVAPTVMDTISRVLNEEVRFPPEIDLLPISLRTALRKLLTRSIEDRYQTASEVVKALERARGDVEQRRASQRHPSSSSERRLALQRTVSDTVNAARAHKRRPRRRRRSLVPVTIAVTFVCSGLMVALAVLKAPRRPAEPEPEVAVAPTPAPLVSGSVAVKAPPSIPETAPEAPLAPETAAGVATTAATMPVPAEAPLAEAHVASAEDRRAWLAELEAVRAAVSLCDPGAVLALERASARAGELAGSHEAEDPRAATRARALAAELLELATSVAAARSEAALDDALVFALEPARESPDEFPSARPRSEKVVRPISPGVADELAVALDKAERFLARASDGLDVEGPDELPLRSGNRRVHGRFSLEQGFAKNRSTSEAFRFPRDFTLDALVLLARRAARREPADVPAGLYALVTGDLGEARKRLLPAGKETAVECAGLFHALWRREEHERLVHLTLADQAWGAGLRPIAVLAYERALRPPAPLLPADDRARALARTQGKPVPPKAKETGKTFDFRGAPADPKTQLPAEWETAEAFPELPAANILDSLHAAVKPEGLTLSGFGRLVWKRGQAGDLVIDVQAKLEEGGGLGITAGEAAEDPAAYVLAGYGVRFLPRQARAMSLGELDGRELSRRRDGLFATPQPFGAVGALASGFPFFAPLEGPGGSLAVVEPDRDEVAARAGKITLRLSLVHAADELRATLARVGDDGAETPISAGNLREHVPSVKSALKVGLVITGAGATVEKVSVRNP